MWGSSDMNRFSVSFKTWAIYIAFVVIFLSGCGGASDESGPVTPPPNGDPNKVLGPNDCLQDPQILPLMNSLELADTGKGGKIYDKWWTAISTTSNTVTPPAGDHPLWSQQTTNTREGEDTWRCKECHGWDYKGVDGVYGDESNSHYTGFVGVFDASTKTPIEVYCAIHSGTGIDINHKFSDVLSNTHILHVTKFIVASQNETANEPQPTGVIDLSQYISAQGMPINATAANGESLYSDPDIDCASSGCHGPDGTRQHEAVGTLADENPWETLHKIRFGHPGSNMPAFGANVSSTKLTLQQSLDIVAYAQNSLPNTENNTATCLTDFASYVNQTSLDLASSIRGGRLYDNWAAEKGTTPPVVDHAIWDTRDQPTINTRSGADTWRCKECHGWDYKGADGVYGDTGNSHYTGFPGLMTVANPALELFCAIRSGTGINPDHEFSGVLSDENILDLVKFLTISDDTGLLETNTYINPTSGDSLGNSVAGQALFDGSNGCSASNCHGTDGTIQHETLGGLSTENPWEVMHKIRFGHPGAIMPSYSDQGVPYFSLTEIRDVIAYTQTLPVTPPGGTTIPPGDERQVIARGGRLYDNWIVELAAPVPPVDNPTLALQSFTGGTNAATGASTWRCKECHGWDYKGSAGVYGDTASTHYTGFGGLLNTIKTEEEIVTYLTSGAIIFGQHVHIFDGLLALEDMQALAKFIKSGMVDSYPGIKADGFVNGLPENFANGRELYRWTGDFGIPNGNCEWCHGTDGNKELAVSLGNVAKDNPWETLHKIRFGQPGSLMPSLIVQTDPLTGNAAFVFQDAIDILQFAQCLPDATCWQQ